MVLGAVSWYLATGTDSLNKRDVASPQESIPKIIQFPFSGTDYENIPKGSSLFDQLVGHWGEVPKGMDDLRDKLNKVLGYWPIPVLFASSRSLQAKSVSIKQPRVVLSSDFHSSLKDIELKTHNFPSEIFRA